jgi:hypothetical protein
MFNFTLKYIYLNLSISKAVYLRVSSILHVCGGVGYTQGGMGSDRSRHGHLQNVSQWVKK